MEWNKQQARMECCFALHACISIISLDQHEWREENDYEAEAGVLVDGADHGVPIAVLRQEELQVRDLVEDGWTSGSERRTPIRSPRTLPGCSPVSPLGTNEREYMPSNCWMDLMQTTS